MKLIKIPFSAGGLGKTAGAEKAPDSIVENLEEFYLNEEGILPVFSIEDVAVNQNNIEETNKNIFEKAKEAIKDNDRTVFVGGDHSITYSLAKGFASVYKKNPGIIIFDAHPDCCSDFNPPTHEDLLLALVKEKIIKKENIILIGIRNWHKDEYKFLTENKIRFFNMKKIAEIGSGNLIETIMETARGFEALYLSIDIDAVDPSAAPGTGYIEPGGLSSRELLFYLHRLKLLKNLKAIDLVEVNPDKDVSSLTVKLAAKLIVELC